MTRRDDPKDTLTRRHFLGVATAAAVSPLISKFARGGDPAAPPAINPAEEKLLDQWQQATLKFFLDYSPKESGLALERTNWQDEVDYEGKCPLATGATGFGVMALVAAANRGKQEFRKQQAEAKAKGEPLRQTMGEWPTDRAARDHIAKVVEFLETKATKYHGAFAHWIEPDGKTFKPKWAPDEHGADLLETSFLLMGLLTAREYFKNDRDPKTRQMCKTIDKIWTDVDWKWYTKNGKEDKLYWHYSPKEFDEASLNNPEKGFTKNMPIEGWCEGLITYVLAASAPNPDHRISRKVYDNGWAAAMKGKPPCEAVTALQYQYSMAGLDPNGLKDGYLEKDCADYWEQGKKHMLAMYEHCVANPHKYTGYGPDCWGLSESDGAPSPNPDKNKYQPRSRKRDDGTIATAAGPGAIIYMPKEAVATMRRFIKDPKIWDECGPVDSFNLKTDEGKEWYDRREPKSAGEKGAPVYIGIHQLPIGVLIENHRSGLLWNLFMGAPEVQKGLKELGMSSPHLDRMAQENKAAKR